MEENVESNPRHRNVPRRGLIRGPHHPWDRRVRGRVLRGGLDF